MSFIGIVCESRNENCVKQILSKRLKHNIIIFFNEENISNLKNIKFETIIIMTNNNKIFDKKEIFKNIISKSKYVIMNADEELNLQLLEDISLNIITYGFNSKSTITASSVKEESVLLCVQRTIKDLNGLEVEPQEISIEKSNPYLATNVILCIATTLLVYGIQKIKV